MVGGKQIDVEGGAVVTSNNNAGVEKGVILLQLNQDGVNCVHLHWKCSSKSTLQHRNRLCMR